MLKIKKKQPDDVEKLIESALSFHQSGSLPRAEVLYRKILKYDADNFDALHMLGVLYAQSKNRELAVKFIKKAIEVNPSSAYAHYNLGNVLRNNAQFDKASSCYRKVIELHRNDDKILEALQVTFRDMGHLDDIVRQRREGSNKSILISVPAFNRKKAVHLSLMQTKRYKTPSCRLEVYNDHSTEYDDDFLVALADEVIHLPAKKGIDLLRWHQFRAFLETDYEFIYMTDSDVIHDPHYITVLEVLYEIGNRKLPVCLFNSAFHLDPRIILYRKDGILLKGTAPGISMFYDRKMVERIVSMLNRHHDTSPWDCMSLKYLGLPWITPETSYLEHYGGGGIHNADYEKDRAINPTEYLQERRSPILRYLMTGEEQQIDW
jgi:tetratricopeptide (TPR) repeat protein